MNRYLSAIIILATIGNAELHPQTLSPAPKLVVNIVIDQLRTDYLEQFSALYTPDGFKKLLEKGCVYEAASYPFAPVDRASAIASIATGTTPHYNNIVSTQWLDRHLHYRRRTQSGNTRHCESLRHSHRKGCRRTLGRPCRRWRILDKRAKRTLDDIVILPERITKPNQGIQQHELLQRRQRSCRQSIYRLCQRHGNGNG